MSTGAERRYTAEDYLALERESDAKHEFFDGEIFAMAGGKRRHSLIAMNVAGEARNGVKSRDCEVHGSDMKVQTPTGLYTYPDVSVVCGKADMLDEHDDVLLNPLLIVEVLSKSTEASDRGAKFANYKTIDSLREYVLVASDSPAIDHFARQPDGTWKETSIDGLEAVLKLPAIECQLPLAEIYRKVRFG